MSCPLPPGAVAPPNGYRQGWGPPFATPRDCPVPDWNHLCPWGRMGRCRSSCYGMSEERMLAAAVDAALAQPQPAAVLDPEAELHVRTVRKKRGLAAATRTLTRYGLTVQAAEAWLAAHTPGVYGGTGSNPPKE